MKPLYEYKNLKCQKCGIIFDSLTRNKKAKYCSKKCSLSIPRKSWGQTAGWNNGIKGKDSHSFGRIFTDDRKEKIGLAHFEDKSYIWKGDNVGYTSLHCWLRRFKKPEKCDNCGKKKRFIDWANISGEYKRDRNDFAALCRSCHWHFDHEKPSKRNDIFERNGAGKRVLIKK